MERETHSAQRPCSSGGGAGAGAGTGGAEDEEDEDDEEEEEEEEEDEDEEEEEDDDMVTEAAFLLANSVRLLPRPVTVGHSRAASAQQQHRLSSSESAEPADAAGDRSSSKKT